MKNYFIIIALYLLSTSVFAQKSENQIENDTNFNSQKKIQISNVTIETFKQLVNKSDKKNKIIYFISNNCSSSVEFTPLLYEIYNNQKTKDFELFVISTKGKNHFDKLYNYLFYNGYYFPVFLISKSNSKEVLKELCSSCQQKFMGYGNFFALNEFNELIIQTDFNFTMEEKLEQIKKIIGIE
ncbi:hypothetical protein [Flavobacterium sp. U410]